MTPGILILKVESGAHARELIDDIFGVDSFAVGEELLTIYGDDQETWFTPLAFTLTEQAFLRRFFGGGVSQSERKTKMVGAMDRAKQIVHSSLAAVGLVDSAAEIARAKAREAQRQLFLQLDAATEAMKEASRELEIMNVKIASGELHVGAARIHERKFSEAGVKVCACKAARTALRNSAPDELRIKYFRKKRELVSTSTRINLLTRQQIPDAERELVKLQEAATSAAKTESAFRHKDHYTRAQLEGEVRRADRAAGGVEVDLEGLRMELTAATERLSVLEIELKEIDAALLAA